MSVLSRTTTAGSLPLLADSTRRYPRHLCCLFSPCGRGYHPHSAKGPRHAGCSAGTPEERVSAHQSDRACGPAAGVRGRCADRRAPRQVIGHTPHSRGHLTPGERVGVGQVVRQRRGVLLGVGHSATRPVAGVYANLGRRPPLVDITAHSYRSATAARPAASTSRWRASSVRYAHFFAGSWSVFFGRRRRGAGRGTRRRDPPGTSRVRRPVQRADACRGRYWALTRRPRRSRCSGPNSVMSASQPANQCWSSSSTFSGSMDATSWDH